MLLSNKTAHGRQAAKGRVVTMKKKTIILILGICIGTFVLCALLFYMVRDALVDIAETIATSAPHWSNFKATRTPDDFGTAWASEDGRLTFFTDDEYTTVPVNHGDFSGSAIIGPLTFGTLLVGEEEIPVLLTWDSHSPSVYIRLYNGDVTIAIYSEPIIEEWYAESYAETDEKIVFSMKVKKTTYYEAGQIVKLVYIKK